MKHLKSFRKVALCIGIFISSIANSQIVSENNRGENKVIILKKRTLNNRPNTPDFQFITCVYSDGNLILDFSSSEGQCFGSVMDLNRNLGQMVSFDSADLTPSIPVGPLSDYSIEFTTEKGNAYYGSTLLP